MGRVGGICAPPICSGRLACLPGRGPDPHDPPFWLAVAALGTAVVSGCLGGLRTGRSRTADLVGLLALGELAWHGFALIQVAPWDLFFRPDPVSESLILANPRWSVGDPPRIRARDSFFLDLQAVRYGIEKTNINDVFQLQHAAALYETLYAVATRTQETIETPMSLAVEDYRQQVRQGVFDRMGVSSLVSDRIEPDPPWPVQSQGQDSARGYVIQQNPTALPRAYVVPRAEVITNEPAMILSRFRSSDPRSAVLMSHDPLAGLPADRRQRFTPVSWLSHDPDQPMLQVFTEAPGLMVMADTWHPGWSALVDGRPVPIYRGNHAQRVIPLEQSGRHTIILRFSPPGLILGGLITAISGLLWAMVGALVLVKNLRPGNGKSGCFAPGLFSYSDWSWHEFHRLLGMPPVVIGFVLHQEIRRRRRVRARFGHSCPLGDPSAKKLGLFFGSLPCLVRRKSHSINLLAILE